MTADPLVVVDLFCGAGGFGTGFVEAFVAKHRETISVDTGLPLTAVDRREPAVQDWLDDRLRMVAVNHWDPAVETYRENHPYATVHNAKVQALHPPDAVDGTFADILIAGPSCIPWSKANGGMAKDDQKRMSPRHVAHWLELLRPDQFLLENVEGFRKWGPIDRSDPENPRMIKDGSCFDDWISTLRTLGYTVDWDTFVAADYGDPQTRKRFFVMGRLNYEPAWPEPTHSEEGTDGIDPWRPASEIIDWSDPGMSLWIRDRDHPRVHKPPAATTLERIATGLRRYCDGYLEPYADAIAGLDREAIYALREDVVDVSDAEEEADRREEPFLVHGDVEPVGLCLPYTLGQHGGAVARDATTQPCSTIATDGYVRVFRPEPLVLPRLGRMRGDDSNPAYPPDAAPLHSVTAKNHDGHLIEPWLVPFYGERDGQDPRTHDVDEPTPSIPASKSPAAICRPFLRVYNGNSAVAPVDEPIPTVPATDRFGLCIPELYPWGLDLRYRMLNPRECARAQGFSDDYELVADTKGDTRTLVGNAVPVELAKALCGTLLEPTDSPTLNEFGETPSPAAQEAQSDD